MILAHEILQLKVHNLGLIDYNEAYRYQQECLKDCLLTGSQHLIVCQHFPVVTLGRMSKQENLLYPREAFEKQGIKILEIDRGGDVTLHAPGQLVVYPIFNLNKLGKDLHLYIRSLEQIVMDTLKQVGLEAKRSEGKTGVWIKEKKIASLGIGVKKWISYHGIGINVSTNLELFNLIRPCGLNVLMTSVEKELKQKIDMKDVEHKLLTVLTEQYPFVVI